MITSSYDIPADGYWTWAGGVFSFPLMTVFAGDGDTAREIAGEEAYPNRNDLVFTTIEAAQAWERLGSFSRPGLVAEIMRGD